jgi:hypothetical protein
MASRSRTQKSKLRGGGYVPNSRAASTKNLMVAFSLAWILGMFVVGWGILFLNGIVTLGGIPAAIVGKVIRDPIAISYFLTADKTQLHYRLEELGIEAEIKAYYRPQIPDEVQLDQYIHQLLYNWTGYVGNNYLVTPQGNLVLKVSGERRLKQELQDLNK